MKKMLFAMALALACVPCLHAQEPAAAEENEIQLSSLKLNDQAPNIVATASDGRTFNLNNYRGVWVVLDFYASWCGDCRKDMPELKKVFDEFTGCKACKDPATAPSKCKCKSASAFDRANLCTCAQENLIFVGVSMDHDADAWKKYIEQAELPWMQVSNLQPWKENEIAKAYDLHWVPTMFYIDPLGRIMGQATTAEELRDLILETQEMLELRDE